MAHTQYPSISKLIVPENKLVKKKSEVEEWNASLIQYDPDWEVGENIYCNWKSKGVFHIGKITKIVQYLDEPVYTVHYTDGNVEDVLQCEAYDRFMPVTEAYTQKSKVIYKEAVKEAAQKRRNKKKNVGKRTRK